MPHPKIIMDVIKSKTKHLFDKHNIPPQDRKKFDEAVKASLEGDVKTLPVGNLSRTGVERYFKLVENKNQRVEWPLEPPVPLVEISSHLSKYWHRLLLYTEVVE